jgi:hypothetical protein
MRNQLDFLWITTLPFNQDSLNILGDGDHRGRQEIDHPITPNSYFAVHMMKVGMMTSDNPLRNTGQPGGNHATQGRFEQMGVHDIKTIRFDQTKKPECKSRNGLLAKIFEPMYDNAV